MPTATPTRPREVDLPVCPFEGCNRVGKIPNTFASGRFYCTGSPENHHRRTKMIMRSFREISPGAAA